MNTELPIGDFFYAKKIVCVESLSCFFNVPPKIIIKISFVLTNMHWSLFCSLGKLVLLQPHCPPQDDDGVKKSNSAKNKNKWNNNYYAMGRVSSENLWEGSSTFCLELAQKFKNPVLKNKTVVSWEEKKTWKECLVTCFKQPNQINTSAKHTTKQK